MSILHRGFSFSVRAANEEKREADVIASTADLDGHGEILDQSTWDLSRYLKNPVVLFGHAAWALPIGRASNVRVEDAQLKATLHFVDARANPTAEQVWQGVRQGSLRAVSVGFRARSQRIEQRQGRDVVVLEGLELLELSVVALPSNPAAVVEAVRSHQETSSMQTKTEKQWFQLSTAEKIALWQTDETKARALKDAPPTFKGKQWHEMTVEEKVACHQTDKAAYLAMAEHDGRRL